MSFSRNDSVVDLDTLLEWRADVEEYITALDGTKLLYRRFIPLESEAKASLLVIHGFGEHAMRLRGVGAYFVKKGFEVHMIDLRGHGLSGGKRAAGSMKQFMGDLEVLHRQARKDIPCFLYGQSMGGLLVLTYGILVSTRGLRSDLPPLGGIIATSPWLQLHKRVRPTWEKRLGLILFGRMLQDFFVSSNVDPCTLSNDEKVAPRTIHDRLVLPLITVGLIRELLIEAARTVQNAEKMKVPLFIAHGEADTITDHRFSIDFVRRAFSKDKVIRIFPDGLHEIHNDKDAKKMLTEISQWISKRAEGIPFEYKMFDEKSSMKKRWSEVVQRIVAFYGIASVQYYLFVLIVTRKRVSFFQALLWPFVILKRVLGQ